MHMYVFLFSYINLLGLIDQSEFRICAEPKTSSNLLLLPAFIYSIDFDEIVQEN